jgi:hypothetical protein
MFVRRVRVRPGQPTRATAFIRPERCLNEPATLEIPEPMLQKRLIGNGKRLVGLS